MAGKGIRKKIIEKLHNKFRLIIYNDTTLQSVWNIKLTPLMLFTVVSLFSAMMIFLVIFLIASTPLKEYIPGYPKAEVREMFLKNYILVDSLEKELATRDKFFENIRFVINGEIPREDYQESDSSSKAKRVEIKTTDYDSLFHDKILEERLSLSSKGERDQSGIPEKLHFFPPMKGLVTNKFDIRKNHFGIDLVGQPGSRISAVLGGTVLFSGWTLETGNVIYLLHGNGLTSAYKHNAELLKKTGDLVKAGEAIAIIGNSGELSTGPHLHFELWYNGQPIDPEKYIVF